MPDTQATTIFAVRHGETEWNLAGLQQGQLDSLLTARGVQQARAMAIGLVGRGIASIYSSDLGRAMRTAEIIASKLNLPVHTDDCLRERHLGSMQGMTKDAFRARYPDQWAAFDSGDPDYCFPGGESARQRFERTVSCIQELAQQHPGQTLLVVAHGGVLDGMYRRANGVALSEKRQFTLYNGSINSFVIAGDEWRMSMWGDVSHLGAMETLDDN